MNHDSEYSASALTHLDITSVMLILAFDTAVAACSVALWRDGVVLAGARETMDQ